MERMDIGAIAGQYGGEDREYKCHLCDKAFTRLWHRTRHLQTHAGEKPHVCQFPGCTTQLSRLGDLNRHSKIHKDPKPRRSSKTQKALQQLSQNGELQNVLSMAPMIPPPDENMSGSTPVSAIGAPIAFPPLSNPYPTVVLSSRYHGHGSLSMGNNFPSLSAYAMSHSHSYDENDHDSHQNQKRSRPNSPNSTSPSSPICSHDSLSPTPDHTPRATSMQAPHFRTGGGGYDLPAIRSLSLPQIPALTPTEPQRVDGQYRTNNQSTFAPRPGSVISNIILGTEGAGRILPALPSLVMGMGQHLVSNFSKTSGPDPNESPISPSVNPEHHSGSNSDTHSHTHSQASSQTLIPVSLVSDNPVELEHHSGSPSSISRPVSSQGFPSSSATVQPIGPKVEISSPRRRPLPTAPQASQS